MTLEQKQQMFELFKNAGKEALKSNHYELVGLLGHGTPDLWKEFLQDTDVNAYIQKESELLQSAEFRKILFGVSDNDTSVGKAQLINAMMAVTNKQNKKEGPVIIYSYIQPNAQQVNAENVKRITEDPFLK